MGAVHKPTKFRPSQSPPTRRLLSILIYLKLVLIVDFGQTVTRHGNSFHRIVGRPLDDGGCTNYNMTRAATLQSRRRESVARARAVSKKLGEDFEDVFTSAHTRHAMFRTLLSVESNRKMTMRHLVIKTALLWAILGRRARLRLQTQKKHLRVSSVSADRSGLRQR